MDFLETMVIILYFVEIKKIIYGMNLMILFILNVVKKKYMEEVLIYYYMKEYLIIKFIIKKNIILFSNKKHKIN